MRNVISLSFLDRDRFFLDGLKSAIYTHLEVLGYQVIILKPFLAEHADVIFNSVSNGRCICYCQQERSSKLFFSLRDYNDTAWIKKPHCVNESGVIYRNDSLDVVLFRIISILRSHRKFKDTERECYWCERVFITARERDIMHCLSLEMRPAAISRYLNISTKTVSSHKATIMRKLGFSKNIELYHWLLRGGLKKIKEHESIVTELRQRRSIHRRTVLAELNFQ